MPNRSADRNLRQYDDGENDDERVLAWKALKRHAMWWEPGWTAWVTRSNRNPAEQYVPIYYRVHIDHVMGHESTRDGKDAIPHPVHVPLAKRKNWLSKAITRVFGGKSSQP